MHVVLPRLLLADRLGRFAAPIFSKKKGSAEPADPPSLQGVSLQKCVVHATDSMMTIDDNMRLSLLGAWQRPIGPSQVHTHDST